MTERRPIGSPSCSTSARHNPQAFCEAVRRQHEPSLVGAWDLLYAMHHLQDGPEGWKLLAHRVDPDKQAATVVLLASRRGRSTMGHRVGLLAATDPRAKRDP